MIYLGCDHHNLYTVILSWFSIKPADKFQPILGHCCHYRKTNPLSCKSMDWFLCHSNTGLKWINQRSFQIWSELNTILWYHLLLLNKAGVFEYPKILQYIKSLFYIYSTISHSRSLFCFYSSHLCITGCTWWNC